MGMQVTVDGNNLDNGSWRFIVEDMGEDISLDNVLVRVVDFVVQGNTAAELTSRWASTRADFIKANPRCTFNLDDSQTTLLDDVSPNDGRFNSVKSTVGLVGGKGHTAFSLYCRLYVEASVVLFNAGGAGGAGSINTTYTGMTDKLVRTRTFDSGRIQSRDVLISFAGQFSATTLAVTIASVANSGGKAVFTIAEVPPAFAEGMRLRVDSSSTVNGAGYAGIHFVTAINVAGKTITTDTAYDGSETGAGYLGVFTTGEALYQAARSSILTDLMGTEADGSRDATTGLYLALEKTEDENENSSNVTVLLQSRWAETELTGINDAQRDLDVEISETEPAEWDPGGGTKPIYLTAEGSIVCDADELEDGSLVLHQVFRAQLVTQLKTYVLSQSGYGTNARLRDIQFASRRVNGRIRFRLVYQARNLDTVFYRSETTTQTEDDRVRWKAGKYHYDQRPDGLPPKTITRTITYVGWVKKALGISAPPTEGGHSYSPGARVDGPEREYDSPDGRLYARAASQLFLRSQYEGGAQGVKVV